MSIAEAQRKAGVTHATLVFERDIPASPAKVFAAFAEAAQRSRWSAPSDTAVLIYDTERFEEQGEDRFRCGPASNPHIHGTTRYLEIVPGERIVSTETLAVDGQRLCVSLTTLEFMGRQRGSQLRQTSQVASFIGPEMIQGHEAGTRAALDNLVRFLS